MRGARHAAPGRCQAVRTVASSINSLLLPARFKLWLVGQGSTKKSDKGDKDVDGYVDNSQAEGDCFLFEGSIS